MPNYEIMLLRIGTQPNATRMETMAEEQPPSRKAKMPAVNLQSMIYTNEGGSTPQLKVLDQLLIPHEKVYIDVPDVTMAYTVIKTMQIRGVFLGLPLNPEFLLLRIACVAVLQYCTEGLGCCDSPRRI